MTAEKGREMELRNDLWRILQKAVEAVSPEGCVNRTVRLDGEILRIDSAEYDLARAGRVIVVGVGKASARMAAALEEVLGERIAAGLVITADGYKVPTRKVEVVEAAHPVPDSRGLEAAERIAALVDSAEEKDLVIVLISGGGSALLTLPAPPVTLSDLIETNQLLLLSGARIQEINTVRKHLSQLKGGQLATRAFPAQVISIILSDVPGDPVDMIASGPTVPDPTTFSDAVAILNRYRLWEKVPAAVRARLSAGVDGKVPDTPKPGDPAFTRVNYVIAGSGTIAAEAAQQEGERLGYNTLILTTTLEGEAREVGKVFAAMARELAARDRPVPAPALVLAAGETTVTVHGSGKGGRNQELALSAALGISGLSGVIIASLGTDGRDGPTDAAGGMVDGETLDRLHAREIDPWDVLARNDSYTALGAVDALINTGPTGTNVADLVAIIVR
jgi:hydroxypyruvate reductase